jgi:DeoR family glycerol-3-phosphate regulon repressor
VDFAKGKPMNSLSKRHGRILDLLGREGTVTIAALAEHLEVSSETIRRDVGPLAARGLVVRMHGAVGLAGGAGEAPFHRRMGENAAAKQSIAQAVAAQVRNGESLAVDTGTTTSFLARALTRRERLEIVTNSTDIARTLGGRNGNRVHLLGGRYNADSGAVLGGETVEAVLRFRVDHAVISAGAIAEDGVMDYDPDEAAFARAVLQSGQRRLVVSDSGKFGRNALIRVCPLSDFDVLTTNAAPPAALARALRRARVVTTVATSTRTSRA